MALRDITYTKDGVLILRDEDETSRYRCMACGETAETALDGTGIVLDERPMIGLCGHNGSLVSEIDADEWYEYVKEHEDERIIVSQCCLAPCEKTTEEPDEDVKTCGEFKYMIPDQRDYTRCYVSPGSLVSYRETERSTRLGRVLDRVYRGGTGERLSGIVLRVLVLSESMDYAYIRYVPLSDMIESRTPPAGVLVSFFLRPDLHQHADLVEYMSRAGELSEGYVFRAAEEHGIGGKTA